MKNGISAKNGKGTKVREPSPPLPSPLFWLAIFNSAPQLSKLLEQAMHSTTLRFLVTGNWRQIPNLACVASLVLMVYTLINQSSRLMIHENSLSSC